MITTETAETYLAEVADHFGVRYIFDPDETLGGVIHLDAAPPDGDPLALVWQETDGWHAGYPSPRGGVECLTPLPLGIAPPAYIVAGAVREIRAAGRLTAARPVADPEAFGRERLASGRAAQEARCDAPDCEQFREWLSGQKADADKRARTAETERDRLRAELEDLAAQNAKTESNFEEFAEDIIPDRDRLRAELKTAKVNVQRVLARTEKAEADQDRLRAVLDEALSLRQHGPATGPAWRAWDTEAEEALRAGEDTAP